MNTKSKLFVFILFLLAACSDESGWTKEQRTNAQNVIEALNARNEAISLTNGMGMMEDYKKYQPVIEKMQLAYNRAIVVHDDVLDKINPDLKNHWKNEFIEGLRLRISNLKKRDIQAEVEGHTLLDKFGDWFSENKNKILIPND